jgi:hypothetical protein
MVIFLKKEKISGLLKLRTIHETQTTSASYPQLLIFSY